MNIEKLNINNTEIAAVSSDHMIITDTPSALDLIMSVHHETGADRIMINKEALTEDFFILSTGLAGEILQKFVNYNIKFAVYGDYSHYTSKPLKDFIYESNQGRHVFFAADKEEALTLLSEAQ